MLRISISDASCRHTHDELDAKKKVASKDHSDWETDFDVISSWIWQWLSTKKVLLNNSSHHSMWDEDDDHHHPFFNIFKVHVETNIDIYVIFNFCTHASCWLMQDRFGNSSKEKKEECRWSKNDIFSLPPVYRLTKIVLKICVNSIRGKEGGKERGTWAE